jgi:CubicO group peptidase (beta-lactamase class C family)
MRNVACIAAMSCAVALSVTAPTAERAGVKRLPAPEVEKIDALVDALLPACRHLNIGIVAQGKVVFTKAYGEGRLDAAYEYGSVSKPVTSTIILQLRREGLIRSLDDNLWMYAPWYRGAMPNAYKDAPLTLRHLLTHRSGIPHNDEQPVIDGRFNLKFRPGTAMLYSTPGYGILGQVIEAVTKLSYSDAVGRYIGEPAGAPSFRAAPSFIAPGAFVFSTIHDMARYGAAMMDRTYVPDAVLYGEILRPETGTYALGWTVADAGGDDLTAVHGGSNGLPLAHLLLKPKRKNAVAILASLKAYAPLDLQRLSGQVLAIIESMPADRTARK